MKNNMRKKYTLEDLPQLKKDNDYLMDTVMGIIETAVFGGDYCESVVDDEDFVDNFLLEELNSGFIKVVNEPNRNSYEYNAERLKSEIEKHKDRLEDIFEFITVNHGEGNFDFTNCSFEYDDIAITNPFMDETGRVGVPPVEYYGSKFVNSKMAKMILDYCNLFI